MSKKLITACIGLVALAAFALPAVSSAANKPIVTHPTGTAMSTRSTTCESLGGAGCILATNIGNTLLKNGEGTTTLWECKTALLKGTLTKNSEGTIEGDISTATISGPGAEFNGMSECEGKGEFPSLIIKTNGTDPVGTHLEGAEDVERGTPYCLRSTPAMAEDEFQLRGGTCSEEARKITFILNTTPFFQGDIIRECKYERPATEPIKGTFVTDTVSSDAIMSVTTTTPANTKFTGEAGNNVLCPVNLTLEMRVTLETDAPTTTPIYISKLP